MLLLFKLILMALEMAGINRILLVGKHKASKTLSNFFKNIATVINLYPPPIPAVSPKLLVYDLHCL